MRIIKARPVNKNGKPKWRVVVPADMHPQGKRSQRWFPDATSAREFAGTVNSQRTGTATRLVGLPQSTQTAVLRALDILGDRALEIEDAASTWVRTAPTAKLSLKELIAEVLTAKAAAGLRRESLRCLKSTLTAFGAAPRGAMMISEVTPNVVAEWLASQDVATATRNGRLIDVCTLFSFAVKRGYLAKNPATAVDKPRRDEKPPGILTVEQCKVILRRAWTEGPDLARWVAVQLFGGLRPAEARQITEEHILAEHINITAAIAKGRRRRLVSINPTLRAWLDLGGTLPVYNGLQRWNIAHIGKKNKITKKRDTSTGPGFKWPHDALRHSFCSYSVPISGAASTAAEAGHTESVLFQHYREVVPKAEAELFWALRPETVSKDEQITKAKHSQDTAEIGKAENRN